MNRQQAHKTIVMRPIAEAPIQAGEMYGPVFLEESDGAKKVGYYDGERWFDECDHTPINPALFGDPV